MDLFNIVVRVIVLLTAIPVHEAAHAYVADKMGDPTGKYMGRLTLNPMAHFDLTGSLAMIFFGIGWAKPVPINPRNFREPRKGMALSAAAGPAANLLVAAISLVIAKIILYSSYAIGVSSAVSTLYTIFSSICTTSIYLAIFNLIPIPPLDGSRIFNYFLPDKYYFKIMQYEQYIMWGLIIVLALGFLDLPLAFASNLILGAINKLTVFVDIICKAVFL